MYNTFIIFNITIYIIHICSLVYVLDTFVKMISDINHYSPSAPADPCGPDGGGGDVQDSEMEQHRGIRRRRQALAEQGPMR